MIIVDDAENASSMHQQQSPQMLVPSMALWCNEINSLFKVDRNGLIPFALSPVPIEAPCHTNIRSGYKTASVSTLEDSHSAPTWPPRALRTVPIQAPCNTSIRLGYKTAWVSTLKDLLSAPTWPRALPTAPIEAPCHTSIRSRYRTDLV